jgi:CheY-like chemotaxis protein
MMRDKRLILIAEDDEIDRMTLRRAFKDAQIPNPLAFVSDGEEALAYLNGENQPCLILLDLNMPRMNGVELLQFLKADPNWRSIPVIILTTSNQELDRRRCFALSAAGYIVKPLGYAAVVNVVKTICAYWMLSEFPS